MGGKQSHSVILQKSVEYIRSLQNRSRGQNRELHNLRSELTLLKSTVGTEELKAEVVRLRKHCESLAQENFALRHELGSMATGEAFDPVRLLLGLWLMLQCGLGLFLFFPPHH